MSGRVPAVGGTRDVPGPDQIARDYLLLALRLDQRVSGLVDAYFGPAELKARVDLEQLPPPARLVDDARELRRQVEAEVADPQRRRWLSAQLRALETHAAVLAGERLPYVELVERCFDRRPAARDEGELAAAAARLDALAPGPGPLAERVDAWEDRLVIPTDRLPAVVDWLVGLYRQRALELFGVPDGETVRVSFVRDRPWSGYNWFDGGLRSRVELNLDLPVRAPDLVRVVAHETFPGHHLEHAWKEADLVERHGRLEASALLINTPECLVSEGLAELGVSFVAPADAMADLLLELFERADLEVARDRARARATAEAAAVVLEARSALSAARTNAALMLHAEGADRSAVRDYLQRVGLVPAARVEKRLEFIEHPLWRTYVFVYADGERLLRRWVESAPPAGRADRFARLLHEQLTPSAITAETEAS